MVVLKILIYLIKVNLFIIILYFYYLKNKIFFKKLLSENSCFSIELNSYSQIYLKLKNKLFFNENISLIKEEKKNIFNLFSRGKNTTLIKFEKIFYINNCRFGNILVILNKLIFYCEIIGCKAIILNNSSFWFIKNKIKIPSNNMTIEVGNYNESLFLFNDSSDSLLYSMFFFKPEIKINFLREEIIHNLPKTLSSKEYLYIHIRSGDIFYNMINIYYAQPPLCFYNKILHNYNFSKVYLISIDNNNPVIEKLINQYPNIIYKKNTLEYDISLLLNAFNIVSSISSFLNLIIQLNYNLKFLWDYNIYKTSEKILLLHYDLYRYPHNNFTIFRMEPTSKYRTLMYFWKNNNKQKKLMIKEKCNNYFSIINKEI